MSLTKASYSMIDGAVANVNDYGASPSASGSANHAAFVAAFASGRKTVFVPEGTYNITGTTITIPDQTEFFGAGKYSTTINFTTTTDADCFVIGWYTTIHDIKIVDTYASAGNFGTLRMQSLTNAEIPSIWANPTVGGLSYKNTLRDVVLESGKNYNLYMVNVAYIDMHNIRAVLGRGGAGNVSIYGKGGAGNPVSTTVFMTGSNEYTASLGGPGITLFNVANCSFQFIAEGNISRAMTVTGDITACSWRNCYFESNFAQGAPAGDAEAVIAAINSNLVFENCYFYQNNSSGSIVVDPNYGSSQYSVIRSCVFSGTNAKVPSVPNDGSWNVYVGQNELSSQYDLLTNNPSDYNASPLRSGNRLFPTQVFNTDPYSKAINSLFTTWSSTYPANWQKVAGTNDVIKNTTYKYWGSGNSVEFGTYPTTLQQLNIQNQMNWPQKGYTAVIVGRNGKTITTASAGYDGSNRTYVLVTVGATNYYLEFPEITFGTDWTAAELDLTAAIGMGMPAVSTMAMSFLIVCTSGTVIGHAGVYASDSPSFIPE